MLFLSSFFFNQSNESNIRLFFKSFLELVDVIFN